MTGPRSHKLRRDLFELVGARDEPVSTGMTLKAINATIASIDEDAAVPQHRVYAQDTPTRRESRLKLADMVGIADYSGVRNFRNDELEAIIDTVREAER
jgi:hypothetical protein